MSNVEEILAAIERGEIIDIRPGSEVEEILLAIMNDETYDGKVHSRVSALLKGISGGGIGPVPPHPQPQPITPWERPSNWPDLDSIDIPDDFDGVYMTYDLTKARGWGWIGLKLQTSNGTPLTLERGHLTDGSFVADDTFSVQSSTAFRRTLDEQDGEIQLWRVTADAPIIDWGFVPSTADSKATLYNDYQPCVEVVGSLKNKSQFKGSNGAAGVCYGTIFLEHFDCALSNVTSMSSMFSSCYALQSISLTTNILSKYYSFTSSILISIASLLDMIDLLPQLESGTTKTLNIGSQNKLKLTSDQIAVATNKGWTVT